MIYVLNIVSPCRCCIEQRDLTPAGIKTLYSFVIDFFVSEFFYEILRTNM